MEMKVLEINNKLYDVEQIAPPATDGGKLVKLKNEFIYAKYQLEVQEQRLLYNAMSFFDTKPFLSDAQVFGALYSGESRRWTWNNITTKLTDSFYSTHESRTIVLSIKYLIKRTGSRNYKAFDNAMRGLQSSVLEIDSTTQVNGKRVKTRISPIECSQQIEDSTNILITFSQSFMQYLLAFAGFKSLELEMLSKLSTKYAARYYHWFLYSLSQAGVELNRSTIELTIPSLRERLSIAPELHKRGFYERVVQKSIDEINGKTDLRVEVEKVYKTGKDGKLLHGRPIGKLRFTVYRTAADYAFALVDKAIAAKEVYRLEDEDNGVKLKLEYEAALQLAEKAAEDAQFCPLWNYKEYKEPDKSLEAIFDGDLFW